MMHRAAVLATVLLASVCHAYPSFWAQRSPGPGAGCLAQPTTGLGPHLAPVSDGCVQTGTRAGPLAGGRARGADRCTQALTMRT